MVPRGILIVDDEPMLRMIASEIAADAGYEPICAATGAEALRIVAEQSAHLVAVVTDIRMPGGIDGLDLVAKIKTLQPQLHVVVMSGAPFDAPIGCRALTKPYRADEFEGALRAA